MISECWWCEKPYEYEGEPLGPDELDVCAVCEGDPGFREVLDRLSDLDRKDCVPFELELKRHEQRDFTKLLITVAFLSGYCLGAAVAFVLSTLR